MVLLVAAVHTKAAVRKVVEKGIVIRAPLKPHSRLLNTECAHDWRRPAHTIQEAITGQIERTLNDVALTGNNSAPKGGVEVTIVQKLPVDEVSNRAVLILASNRLLRENST